MTGTQCPECAREVRIDNNGHLARHPDPTYNHTCPGTGEPAK